MVTLLRSVYNSGIVGDYARGALSVKPDNTVESILCMRRHEFGRCSFYEQSPVVSNVLYNNSEVNHFVWSIFMNKDKTSFLDMDQDKMKCNLLGDAHEGTVYIRYWFCGQQHVVYYDIPNEDIVFPIYTSSETQQTFLDDEDFIINIHVVFNGNHEDDTVDVTENTKIFVGPKNDFHGRMQSNTVNFTRMFDYNIRSNSPVSFSSVMRRGNESRIRLTFADMHTKLLQI